MKLKLALVGNDSVDGYEFDSAGGVFGRSKKCDWVLPDNDRILSSMHGRISFKDGQFILTDDSTNGIFIDGQQTAIGRGNSIALTHGMRFYAGRHLIVATLEGAQAPQSAPEVTAQKTERSSGTLTDLLSPNGRSSGPVTPLDVAPQADLSRDRANDPLAYFDDDSLPAPSLKPQGDYQAATPSPATWEPAYEQPETQAEPAKAPRHAPDVVVANQPTQRESSAPEVLANPAPTSEGDDIARLANLLEGGDRGEPPAAPSRSIPDLDALMADKPQPSPQIPEIAPVQPPVTAPDHSSAKAIPDDFDLLSVLGTPKRAAPPQPQAPQPLSPQPIPPQPQPVPSAPKTNSGLPSSILGDLMHIPEPTEESREQVGAIDPLDAMKARRTERAAALKAKSTGALNTDHPMIPGASVGAAQGVPSLAPSAPAAAWDGMPPAVRAAPTAQNSPVSPATNAPTQKSKQSEATDQEALSLFFSALGFPNVDLTSTEHQEAMLDAGRMIRETAKGLILLLSARKMVKSEFRMDETQIRPEDNNPFKHFKISELALDEMFLTRKGGYLSPPEAVNEAFDDLQQHTMLTMSAMQKAIKLLFDQLSPEAIAQQAEQQGGRIKGLGIGKSEWAMYVEQHERLSGRIDGLARQIISEAFAQAEEEFARKMASQQRENYQ